MNYLYPEHSKPLGKVAVGKVVNIACRSKNLCKDMGRVNTQSSTVRKYQWENFSDIRQIYRFRKYAQTQIFTTSRKLSDVQ